MSFVIYNKTSFQRLRDQSYATERAAKGALTRYLKKFKTRIVNGELVPIERSELAIDTYDNWYANEPEVTVYSIFDLKKERPIKIRASQRGGCCDPSMELYHTM